VDDRSFDNLLKTWRESNRDETLSSDVRSSLFIQVRAMGAEAVSGWWRFVVVGAIPLVALATLLVLGARNDLSVTKSGKLTASKVDGHVVFTLANGKKQHLVFRSTDPRSFNPAAGVRMTANRFEVDATGGPNLVFYRID
jgi:hypothetical protein